MKKNYFFPLILSVFLVSACGTDTKKDKKENEESRTNPFLIKSELPFEAPNFEKIQNGDFKPAIEAGIKKKEKEIEEIANNEEAATFENTLVALERSGEDLGRVLRVFNLLTGAHTNDTLKKVREEMSSRLAALNDAVYLNDNLFQRVKAIHDQKDDLNLDSESKRLVDYYYEKFELAGANLSDDKKEELKKLNGELADLMTRFSNQLLEAGKESALFVDSESDLAGLSESEINAASSKAKADGKDGEYELSLQNTTQQPALANLENRDTRKALFEKSIHRADHGGENDTREILKRIAHIRAEQAALLGYDNYAQWNLESTMAKNPEAVEKFLGKIVPAATAKAKEEAVVIQKMIKDSGEDFKLEPWDWNFYAEKVRKAHYDLDEREIRPYFEINNVLEKGVFYAAEKLYGLTFKEREDIPIYQDDVRVFEVFDQDGSTIGLFYSDFYKRDNKRGGAWMSNIVGQSHLMNTKPVIYNVCNFNKPADGEPALISFDNVITMFHEFGHALHGFFADQQYPSLSGTSVARDFVEFPSQFNEHWALHPEILKNYAKHYETGEVIPEELVAKIEKSSTFNEGYAMTELLASAQLDMQYHIIGADDEIGDVDTFEKEALKRTKLYLDQVPPRYRSSYFSHIWGSGYAAGYYAYIWTKMLDADAYSWFEENGGMTRENGDRFRAMILSKGDTEDYGEMFKAFRGSDPNINPLLKAKGLK